MIILRYMIGSEYTPPSIAAAPSTVCCTILYVQGYGWGCGRDVGGVGDSVREDEKNKGDRECSVKCSIEQWCAVQGRRYRARLGRSAHCCAEQSRTDQVQAERWVRQVGHAHSRTE